MRPKRHSRLSESGEGELIRWIQSRFRESGATIGIGDDAAILEVPPGHSLVFCADLLAENTHFTRDLHPAQSVGYKAVAANVSDVGAMGGTPMYFTISLAAPPSTEMSWLEDFYAGVERACSLFGVSLVGGDSSSAETIFVDVAMIGRIPTGSAVPRSGARPGDGIYITGNLGNSSVGWDLLQRGTRSGIAVDRHLYPAPPYRVGAAMAGRAHAMIDVSDGLSTDLGHIAEASRVSARIYKDQLPRAQGATDLQMLHGGEEYELIIVGPELPGVIEGVRLTRVGEIIAAKESSQVVLVDGGAEVPLEAKGWQHFKE